MKCTKCGADGENGKFCSSCGNKLEENLVAEETQGYEFVEGEQMELSTTSVNKRKGFLDEKIRKFLKKIVLVFTIILLLCGMFASSGIGTKKDAVVEIITYYAYLGVLYIIPVGLIMNLGGIRDKLPLFKHHKLGKTVLGSLVVYMVMGFLCMGIAFGMDSLHTETYKIEYAKMLEERAKEAEKKAQEEERKAQEEAKKKAQEEAEKKAQEEAEKKVQEETEKKAQEESDKEQKKEKEKIAVNKEQDASDVEAEYLFADSDSVYYEEEQLISGYDYETLWLGKNEIYARHGYIFKNDELKNYFEKQSWYQGEVSSNKFNNSVFNKYEKANIQSFQDAMEHMTNNEDLGIKTYEELIAKKVVQNKHLKASQMEDDGSYFDEIVSGAWYHEDGTPKAEFPPSKIYLRPNNVGYFWLEDFKFVDGLNCSMDEIMRSSSNQNKLVEPGYIMLLSNISKEQDIYGNTFFVGWEYFSYQPVIILGNFNSIIMNGDNVMVIGVYEGLSADDTPNFRASYVEICNGRF